MYKDLIKPLYNEDYRFDKENNHFRDVDLLFWRIGNKALYEYHIGSKLPTGFKHAEYLFMEQLYIISDNDIYGF